MHNDNFFCLGNLPAEDFLNQYWQKKPLLIKNAFPKTVSPLTAEELAGLACEQHVNSRIVLQDAGTKPWQVEFGPFDESRFSELPESNWSLLVSDVERHLPETKSILKAFRFIPDWRIDDLMISYAPIGGSVGAHTDVYDVFLIQLSGRRHWKISEHFSAETREDTDLPILKEFQAEQEWILEAGDMLYLPPNVAHHGIAQSCKGNNDKEDNCMTASVGFRAPSLKTISSDYIHFINDNDNSDKSARYQDKTPVIPTHHAEISEDTVTHFIEDLKKGLALDREQVKRWLGKYCSDNKAFDDFANEQQDIDYKELSKRTIKSRLIQSPYSQFLFSQTKNACLLFVDGESFECSKQFANRLCNDEPIDFQQFEGSLTNIEKDVLLNLFNNGSIIIADSAAND